jgi:Phosphodiester glycosidase
MAAVATLVGLGVPIPTTSAAGASQSLVDKVEVSETVRVDRGVEWTRIVRANGPVRINVLTVDPARVRGVLANGRIAGLERVSRMGRRVGAVAGVNGTYFAPSGDPVGVLALDGELLSEPVDGRSALILPAAPPPALASPPFIARVRFQGRVTVNGRSRRIDGIDRMRGLIPACGGRGGDVPTIRPNAVLTCTDSSELVLLTPRYGALPPREGGVEAIVRDGRVTRVRPPGTGRVPRDGLLLTGTGDAARFLRDAALPRSPVEIRLRLTAGGRVLAVTPAASRAEPNAAATPAGGHAPPSAAATPAGSHAPPSAGAPAVVLGHGPRLLRADRLVVRAAAGQEGFKPPQAPSFFRSFVAGRNPRTLAGVRADGTLLLVTVDGRRPAWSVGMTLPEAARLMRSLGARDALNLDGGGSSTMTIRGEVVNRPSDRVGERPVSNGLFVMP